MSLLRPCLSSSPWLARFRPTTRAPQSPRDHFKALKVAGTINADPNPVDWTKLKGVPGGLADGVDDGVTVAGFGLNKVLSAFWVDPTEVQKRVTTACPSGQAISSISQEGTAVCTPVSQALSATDPDTGIICNAWCQEGSLMLSPGTWVITAKIGMVQGDLDEDRIWAWCRLHAAASLTSRICPSWATWPR